MAASDARGIVVVDPELGTHEDAGDFLHRNGGLGFVVQLPEIPSTAVASPVVRAART
jgi:hypothetical protein